MRPVLGRHSLDAALGGCGLLVEFFRVSGSTIVHMSNTRCDIFLSPQIAFFGGTPCTRVDR